MRVATWRGATELFFLGSQRAHREGLDYAPPHPFLSLSNTSFAAGNGLFALRGCMYRDLYAPSSGPRPAFFPTPAFFDKLGFFVSRRTA